jgi:hypothetical protein
MRWMLISAAALLGAVSLSGCAASLDTPEVRQAITACNNKYATAVGRVTCGNAVIASHGGTGDLMNVLLTKRLALAEKVDSGQMTRAEANAEMAALVANVNSEQQRRDAAAWAAVAASMPTTCNSTGSYGYVTTTCY